MGIFKFFKNPFWHWMILSFSLNLFSFNPPSTIHLDMSSKKVSTKRNQLEVIFKYCGVQIASSPLYSYYFGQ